MTKRTFEGRLIVDEYGPPVNYMEKIGDDYPARWLMTALKPLHNQEVRVSIEVEPITLKDRVAKIFDSIDTPDCWVVDLPRLRQLMLAELERP
jgi:hypothetical protein